MGNPKEKKMEDDMEGGDIQGLYEGMPRAEGLIITI